MATEPALVGAYKFLPLRAKSAYVRTPNGQEYAGINRTVSPVRCENSNANAHAIVNNIPSSATTNKRDSFVSKSLVDFNTKSAQYSNNFNDNSQINENVNYQQVPSNPVNMQRPQTSRPSLNQSQRLIELQNTNLNLKRMLELMINDPEGTRNKLLSSRPVFRNRVETPRIRQGRLGSQWRHIKATNNYSGVNYLFIDGTVRIDDNLKYPPKQYGYPPKVQKLDDQFNGLTTQSLIDLTSPMAAQLRNRTPSVSKADNMYHEHAKQGFRYWMKDTRIPENNKPKAKPIGLGQAYFKSGY